MKDENSTHSQISLENFFIYNTEYGQKEGKVTNIYNFFHEGC
jgi:hypothetical protein